MRKTNAKCKQCGAEFSKDYNEPICSRGCDYRRARDLEREAAERQTGCKYGEAFFTYKGLRLVADGYEAPFVVIGLGDKQVALEEHEIEMLLKVMIQARDWCQNGWCPGIL
jgi:hypothetical protein